MRSIAPVFRRAHAAAPRLLWILAFALPLLLAACNNSNGGGPGY